VWWREGFAAQSTVILDRGDWNCIRHLQTGETCEHTITKSELYHGKKVTYYAPFDMSG
jgi:hypothetical protein